jgi:hypothetical protein
MKIQNIFEELNKGYLCDNAYEFSTAYLGKCKSYYSVLKANKLNPSISTLAVLEMALIRKADEYLDDEYNICKRRRKHLLKLSNSVKLMRQQQCDARLKLYAI